MVARKTFAVELETENYRAATIYRGWENFNLLNRELRTGNETLLLALHGGPIGTLLEG